MNWLSQQDGTTAARLYDGYAVSGPYTGSGTVGTWSRITSNVASAVAQNGSRDSTMRWKTSSGSVQTLVPDANSGARLHPYTANSMSRPDTPSGGACGFGRNDSRYGLCEEMNGSVW